MKFPGETGIQFFCVALEYRFFKFDEDFLIEIILVV